MSKTLVFFIIYLCCVSARSQSEDTWRPLLDGAGLAGWDTYLGGRQTKDASGKAVKDSVPVGLNNDIADVFTMVDVDGKKALRVSGEIWGGISTKESFENYHLQLQFKWGETKWFPRDGDSSKRDSGLLYHGVGEQGAGSGFWLRSQELQIQEGDCGDYWGVAGAVFDVTAAPNKKEVYQYDPKAPLVTFSEKNKASRHCKKYPDNEKKSGKWNTIDLYCFEGTAVHIINGKVVMVLQNSRQVAEEKEMPLTKGKIQLQSESAEVFYRDIKIRSISNIPDDIMNR